MGDNSNSNVKIDITADASGTEPGFSQTEAKLEHLGRSSGKLANEYSGLDAATKKMTGSMSAAAVDTKKLDAELTSLLTRINPAYAAVKNLDQGTDLLKRGMASGLITSQQYNSSIGLLEASFAKANRATGESAFMTARAKQEMVVLGRELASGNFSRMPGTLSIIAQGLSPVALGIAGVTTVLAAGAYAWWEWETSAEEASNGARLAVDRARNAAIAAEGGVEKTTREKLNDLERQIEFAESNLAVAERRRANSNIKGKTAESDALDMAIISRRRELEALQRQVDQVQFHDQSKNVRDAQQDNDLADRQIIEQEKARYAADQAYSEAEDKANEARVDRYTKWDEAEYQRQEKQSTDLTNLQIGRFETLQQAAEDYGATELERAEFEEARQLADLERQRMILATDHNLTLGEELGFENAKLAIKKRTRVQKEQMGKAAFIQDLATLGKESAAFMTLYKVAAVAEIMAAGGVRAEKSAAWAATWGGPIAAAAAFGISWAATLANAAMVSGLAGTGGGGGGGGGGAAGGSIPMPESPLPSTIDATAPKPALMVNINLGDTGLFSAGAVRDLIGLINEQIRDGATIDQIRVNG